METIRVFCRSYSFLFALLFVTTLSYSIPSSVEAAVRLLFPNKGITILGKGGNSSNLADRFSKVHKLPAIRESSSLQGRYIVHIFTSSSKGAPAKKGIEQGVFRKQVTDAFARTGDGAVSPSSKAVARQDAEIFQVALLAKGSKGQSFYLYTPQTIAAGGRGRTKHKSLEEGMTAWKQWFNNNVGTHF